TSYFLRKNWSDHSYAWSMRILACALLFLSACTGTDACRCQGDLPEGRLDVACGQQACVGGTGYVCDGPNSAHVDPTVCGVGSGAQPDGGDDNGDLAHGCIRRTCWDAAAGCGPIDDGC